MEVHHHSHTARKKWTHYFWEFLMLFLAVTLGFLVENQREHYIEYQRAKEYARSMYDDLKKDTLFQLRLTEDIQAHLNSFDTVNTLFGQTPSVSNQRLIAAVLPQRTTYTVRLISTTFNQMKSSGTLRYFTKTELSKSIASYYDFYHAFINKSLDYIDDFFTNNIQQFMLDHFDYNESDYFTDTLKVKNPVYLDHSPKTDLLLRNRMILFCSLMKFTINDPVRFTRQKAIDLMHQLKREYHMK